MAQNRDALLRAQVVLAGEGQVTRTSDRRRYSRHLLKRVSSPRNFHASCSVIKYRAVASAVVDLPFLQLWPLSGRTILQIKQSPAHVALFWDRDPHLRRQETHSSSHSRNSWKSCTALQQFRSDVSDVSFHRLYYLVNVTRQDQFHHRYAEPLHLFSGDVGWH